MQFHPRDVVALFLLAGMTTLALIGCQRNERRPLAGEVTLDGKPLAGATISFQPAPGSTGGTSGALLDPEGRFSISAQQGLIPGKYAVTIQKWKGTGRFRLDNETHQRVEITAPIPFKEDGKLEATITEGGPNHFEFRLTRDKEGTSQTL